MTDIPEWVSNALKEIEAEEQTTNSDGKTLVRGSPARFFNNGRENGIRATRQILLKHMPAELIGPAPVLKLPRTKQRMLLNSVIQRAEAERVARAVPGYQSN